MNEYRIGIIDDRLPEVNSIERTIDTKKNENSTLYFKNYIGDNSSNIDDSDNLIEAVLNDIISFNIYLLIIDNKLLLNKTSIDGTRIYEEVKKMASNFPVVIMTNYKEVAYKNDDVDPDKVYDKSKFFSDEKYIEEKINSMFLCMDRYLTLRRNAESTKERLEEKYKEAISDDGEQQILAKMLIADQEVQKYTPVDTSYLEEIISPDRIREIIEFIDEIDKKVE